MRYSVLNGNQAVSRGYPGHGGGACVSGAAAIYGSTISFNVAGQEMGSGDEGSSGALEVLNGIGTLPTTTIVNSTIAYNEATWTGGISVQSNVVNIRNSTVARNRAFSIGVYAPYDGVGVRTYADTLTIDSTIIANNEIAGTIFDMSARPGSVTGSNNLITHAAETPPGTLTTDPMLGVLRLNGGPTATLALQPGSPAIDAGNNSLDLSFDQRGSGYPRTVGMATDIGAFEYSERIFADGFESSLSCAPQMPAP